ncbi:MAG: prepilin-type N-terminal cleavage/methylation domain-containing protein [Candidatus Obscuribacterales bacterium]|nr:prepilin-type N-terminal cleavage/methylation domain-containing protein [Candidatus Obscuribacterales bacterium]
MRNSKGMSLVELLVATTLMAFVSAADLGMVSVVANDAVKVENKCDNLNTVRNAMDKISRGIRMGRSLGDSFGSFDAAAGANTGSITFPSNQNPIYPGSSPPSGWPIWADGTQPQSFTLSSSTLIVQRPIFDITAGSANFGYPLVIKGTQGNPALGRSTCNVTTDIYRVVADPQNAGEYLLQWAQLPGLAMTGYTRQQIGPITLVKGIIGPLPGNGGGGVPAVFSYLLKPGIPTANPGASRTPGDGLTPALDSTNISNFSGVNVNVEVNTHINSGRAGSNNAYIKTSTLAFKQSMYLRNNSLASITGP